MSGYAYDATGFVDPVAAYAAGYRSAIRYLGGGKPTPTRAELDAYFAAGIAVAFVYETDGRAAATGYASGYMDVLTAERIARAVGFPQDRPIYYAPWDSPSDCGPAEDQYWRAVQNETRRPSFAAYGSGLTLGRAAASSRCAMLWHVETWGTIVDDRVTLVQLANTPGPPIDGVAPSAYDANLVLAVDHGQWPAPTPTPTPTHRPGVHAMTVCYIEFHGMHTYLVQAGLIVHEWPAIDPNGFGIPSAATAFVDQTGCGLVGIDGGEWSALLKRSGIIG